MNKNYTMIAAEEEFISFEAPSRKSFLDVDDPQ